MDRPVRLAQVWLSVRHNALKHADLERRRSSAFYLAINGLRGESPESYQSRIAEYESAALRGLGLLSEIGALPPDMAALWNVYLDCTIDSEEAARAVTRLLALCREVPPLVDR